MKGKRIVLASLALAFALAVGVSSQAMAYFTDHHTANGGLVFFQPTTEIHEWYVDQTKHLKIKNADDAKTPVYVRAGVYSSLDTEVRGESGWSESPDGNLNSGKGWYYYEGILEPGDETSELTVTITFPPEKSPEQPQGAVEGDNYNVDVVYESTPVRYKSDGTAYPADWSASSNISG